MEPDLPRWVMARMEPLAALKVMAHALSESTKLLPRRVMEAAEVKQSPASKSATAR
jgi:hypothetical protein